MSKKKSNQNHRVFRVADAIKREISAIVTYEVNDPRVDMITVTGVEVSNDLGHAKVYVTTMNENKSEMISVLNKASGFIRSTLAQRLTIRAIPTVKFYYDDTWEKANRIATLLEENRPSPAVDEETESTEDE